MCQEPWKAPRIQCCGSSAIQNQICRLVSDHLVGTLGQLLSITTCPLLPLTFSLTSWTCKEFLLFWTGQKAQWMLLMRTHRVLVKTASCPVPHFILSQTPCEVHTAVFLALQKRKLRPREMRPIAPGHRAWRNCWTRLPCINCCMVATLVSPR